MKKTKKEQKPTRKKEEMIKELLLLPEKIKNNEEKVITCYERMGDLKKEIDSKKSIVMDIINTEVDDNGKKVYSNKTARDVELNKRLSFMKEYNKLKEEILYLKNEIESLKTKIGFQKRTFKGYNTILLVGKNE